MVVRTHGTNGRQIDIDKLCDAINAAGDPTRGVIVRLLREVFPEVLWAIAFDGKLSAMVHADYGKSYDDGYEEGKEKEREDAYEEGYKEGLEEGLREAVTT